MKLHTIAGLATLGLTCLIEPSWAGGLMTPAPGAIAGIGLPALALIGGAYWMARKYFGRK